MSAQHEILLSVAQGVASVSFNRPRVKNALSFAMCRELLAFLESIGSDPAVRVLLLRSEGADFTSGADLNDVSGMVVPDPKARSLAAMASVRTLSIPLFAALQALPQPVVCSVRGYAIGAGMQMALLSDLVVASRSAKFVLPQVRLGHSVDHGESWTLPRKVGFSRAMQIIALGETVSGADAERFGIANWVVEDEELETTTSGIVARLSGGATVALREIKSLLKGAAQRSFADQFEAEVDSLGRCAASADFAEAIHAFIEKRKPQFRGR
jgi:2-(1,2-epoxy-1,2-dihydrophenyl)acetyl-CoA isomerase